MLENEDQLRIRAGLEKKIKERNDRLVIDSIIDGERLRTRLFFIKEKKETAYGKY